MNPDDLNVKILGIVGTPIKNGNCQYYLEQALKVVESEGRASTELVHLQDYLIEYCNINIETHNCKTVTGKKR
jgi:multimeric flavodoxin WrbA